MAARSRRSSRGRARRILGLILLTLGLLALVYGGFSYTEERHDVDLGPLEFSIKDKERVDVPAWLGIVGVVAGAALLVSGRR